MVLTNPYRPDPRVQREIEGLILGGYKVTLVCWDRQAEFSKIDTQDGITVRRVQDIRTVYGAGWRQLFYLPRFWRRAQGIGIELTPQIVHCHDLDTLWVGARLKKQIDCTLVYDAHEHYPATLSLYLPGIMCKSLVRWEDHLINSVDLTITASTVLSDEFQAKGIKNVVAIGNYPRFDFFSEAAVAAVKELRTRLKSDEQTLLVGYIAGLTRDRMILPLIQAADFLPTVQFHIWGDGAQRTDVQAASHQRENVHYHGWLPFSELPAHFHALDIVYYGLRKDYPGAVYNAPNTLTQAMAAGRPIIATDVGDLGRIIRDTDCGVLLKDATPKAIADAIQWLTNSDERSRLGTNGRQAAQKKYNAANNQKRLVELYEKLLEGN
jgi:glycosyltransferase involved in cell wall biosynthesis